MDTLKQFWMSLPKPLRIMVYVILALAVATTVYLQVTGQPLV